MLFQLPKGPSQCSLTSISVLRYLYMDLKDDLIINLHTHICYATSRSQPRTAMEEELSRWPRMSYKGLIWGIGPVGTILWPLIYWRLSVSIQDQRMQYPYLLMRPIVVRLDMIKMGARLECIIVPV